MNVVNIENEGRQLSLIISHNIKEISERWTVHAGGHIYAHEPYLSLLESAGPKDYGYVYALLSDGDKIISACYFQHKTIRLAEDFRVHTHKKDFVSRFRVSFLKSIFKLVKHDILISGNVLLTGEYAYSTSLSDNPNMYSKILAEVCGYIKKVKKINIKTILAKDFYVESDMKKSDFHGEGFTQIEVQPDMIFPVSESWNNFSDYLSAVRSKYRVKFKKVKKKGGGLNMRLLSQKEAQRYNNDMYALYKATADRAVFSLFLLDPQYFYKLKETLGEDLSLFGVFKEEELVGFFTFVKNGAAGDAHFLGYDVTLNSKYQLYFNILLRLIEEAIDQKVSYLNLSRTALEIKSSVGAEPHRMHVYVKHRNGLVNKMLPKILEMTVPKNEWVQRSPFGK